MLADRKTRPAPIRRPRRGPADHVRDALQRLGGGHPLVLSHSERAWASITFSGARHTVSLMFTGTDAVDAAERLIDALPEHEFTIPGKLVADAAIKQVDHALLPIPQLQVEVELLLLEDA